MICVSYLASAGCKADQDSSYAVLQWKGVLQMSIQKYDYHCILLCIGAASDYMACARQIWGLMQQKPQMCQCTVYHLFGGGRTNFTHKHMLTDT